MPPPKHQSTLSGLVDSDTDDALTTMPTPDSAAENNMATKKVRARATKVRPTKVTKTKAPAHRASRRVAAKTQAQGGIEAPVRKGRRALADKTNRQYPSDTEEVDDFETADDEDATMEEAPLAEKMAPKQTKPKKKAAVGRGRAKVTKEATKLKPDIEADTPDMPVVEARTTKRKGPAKKEVISEPFHEEVIAETQLSEAEVEDTLNEEVEDTVFKSARNAIRQRPQPLIQHQRAGSASDTERSDPALRRRLGDMTKKYENLHLKYQDMREIGLKEAERNFERLKKQSEEKTKVSNELIASLKAELATQTALAKESKSLKKRADSQTTEITALTAQITQLTTLLSESQVENKTLSTKLAANRTAAASVASASSKIPNSAVKANGGIRMIGTVEAAQVAQAAQLKEDIYSDLTGLIIRNVKREPEEDIFDCIQTGRNGTLHFKLAAANEKSAESYEDAQCSYTPQLDPSRDEALMELLPDYLVDEITFPRPQAAKFYARVVKALTEKPAQI